MQEQITERHEQILGDLKRIDWLWKNDLVDVALSSQGESAACDLTPFLRDGITGALQYSARFERGMYDKAMFDDIMTFRLEESKLRYNEFCPQVFSNFIDAFNPYRAAIVMDLDLDLDDWDSIVELAQRDGIDADGRDTVFRINPVNFFDEQLCKRAFQLNSQQVVNRLHGHVQEASIVHGGAFIIVTNDLVDRANLNDLHRHVAGLLGLTSVVPV
jgi:hypothetical protein